MNETYLYQEKTAGIALDRVQRPQGFSMPVKHMHAAYEIYYLVEGERHYFIEKQTYDVKAKTLVFIDRWQAHMTSQADAESHDRILINLDEEPFSALFSLTGEMLLSDFFRTYQGVLPLDADGQRVVEELFSLMAREMSAKRPGYRLAVQTALAQLLIFSKRQFDETTRKELPAVSTSTPHRKVDEVAAYIVGHYAENLTLESVAARFFVSKCYLSRIFKEVTGFTVSEYIHVNRIKQAQNLLAKSSLNITQISERLGYDTITYFERTFKKFTGMSPLRYRKNLSLAE